MRRLEMTGGSLRDSLAAPVADDDSTGCGGAPRREAMFGCVAI
jgi:hypothetical protein